jgi:Ca2+-dependent lipid-binding protein
VVGNDKLASVLTLALAPVEEEADQSACSEAEPSQRGSLWVTVKGASGLPKMKIISGKADPFLVFLADGVLVHKTAVKRGTLAPVWEEQFEVRCTSGMTSVIAQVVCLHALQHIFDVI